MFGIDDAALALGGMALLGNLGGGMLNLFGTSDANETAKDIARSNRRWMTRMSNTAHQREVDDLRAAGLNPILSATGGAGASTPSADTSANIRVPDFGDLGASSFLNAVSTAQSLKKMDSDIAVNNAAAAQSQSAAQLNQVTAQGKQLQNDIAAATKEFDINKKKYGAQSAEATFQRQVSDNLREFKRNSWWSSSEGHSAWTREQISKSQGKFTKELVNAVPSVVNYFRSDSPSNWIPLGRFGNGSL